MRDLSATLQAFCCSGFVLFVAALQGAAASEQRPPIGTVIRSVEFKDIRYLPHTLDEFRDQKAIVLVFANTTCPLVQQYLPEIKRLEKAYRDQAVQFLAVNSGMADSIVDMAAQGVRHELEFPLVKDFDGRLVAALGIRRTPEVAILDSERRLQYRGRIDDRYRLGGALASARRHDLEEALQEILAGRPATIPETPVDGCRITLAPPVSPVETVTFAEHVAPLLKKHCQECHQPGTEAPFPLTTYEEAAAQAEMIAETVQERRMPPWYASAEHGSFMNRRGMAADEQAIMLQWIRTGLARGEPAVVSAAAPVAPARWQNGAPDLIVTMTLEHSIPAIGPIPYQYVVLPHIFLQETWIEAAEILPSNPRIVHHCNLALASLSAKEGGHAQLITGKVPGHGPMKLGGGVAVRIPAGSVLALQIHYTSTGRPEKNRISVGLRFPRQTVRKELRFLAVGNHQFLIPPGAAHHPVSASRVFPADAIGIGLFAHMHLRGKDIAFQAHRTDGQTETLLVVPNYSFDWQMPYVWPAGQKRFSKGDRIECCAHFDNSPFNPYNPDPLATVQTGPRTEQEMMLGYLFYVREDEDLQLRVNSSTGRAERDPIQ